MQSIRVIGIRRKRLLAAKLSIEILFGPQMAVTGFAKRRRAARAV